VIAPPTTECFRFEEYACWSKPGQETGIAAKAVRENANNPLILEDAIVETTVAPGGAPNDIFKRTFVQYCGNRGNACSGEIEDTITKEVDCGDINLDLGEEEHCRGPSRYPSCELKILLGQPKCYDYGPGESFEKNFAITDLPPKKRDGICNENWKRSALGSPRGAYDVPTGPYDCQATCNQGECNYATNCICNAEHDDNVAEDCDGKAPGHAFDGPWDWGSKLEFGCQVDCTVIDCTPWVFDPNTKSCRQYARDERDCDEDGTFNEALNICE
jgi:hypothetical protein